jgi:hypothetical protein
MSRTYKDVKWEVRFPERSWDIGRVWNGYCYLKIAGFKTKKKKKVNTEWHWMGTPSWWTRLMMNRPQRVASKQYEKIVVGLSDLEEVDFPLVSKKPHIYYW